MHAWIVGALIVLARVFLVPVENAAHEGRDERGARVGGGDGLMKAEEQRQVAVNAFLLEHFGGANAFPCGGDLDEDAIAADVGLLIHADDVARLRDGFFGVVGEACINFRGDAAGDDRENLFAEGNRPGV